MISLLTTCIMFDNVVKAFCCPTLGQNCFKNVVYNSLLWNEGPNILKSNIYIYNLKLDSCDNNYFLNFKPKTLFSKTFQSSN